MIRKRPAARSPLRLLQCCFLQDNCLQALRIALQHPALAEFQDYICTLLQVCKSWRAVVQQSTASLTNVDYYQPFGVQQLSEIAQLAKWVAKYPGLVGSVTLDPHVSSDITDPADSEALIEIVQQLLELSLQLAASRPGAPLRLRSFTCSLPPTAEMLATLPATTLTSLTLWQVNNTNWFAGLSSLSHLQRLHVRLPGITEEMTDRCLSQIGKLQQLTQLELCRLTANGDMQLLPTQLQHLEILYIIPYSVSKDSKPEDIRLVSLQHLECLQQLKLRAAELAAGSALPSNLHSLELDALWTADSLAGFASLQQVTSVMLRNQSIGMEHLRLLEQLPKLQELSMVVSNSTRLLEEAAVWRKLPLVSLQFTAQRVTADEMAQLMQHVARATKIREISINVDAIAADGMQSPQLAICEHLKALKNIKCLSLAIDLPHAFAAQDTQHLSALITLTRLQLCHKGSGPYLDSDTLCLLALSLTALKHLDVHSDTQLFDSKQSSIPALSAIGKLTALTTLRIEELSQEEADRGFQFLTALSDLDDWGSFGIASDEVLAAFLNTPSEQLQETS